MAALNIKFKRIIRKYEFLLQELEDCTEMLSSATRTFNEALSNTEEKEFYEKEKPPQKEDEEIEKIQIESKYKKLFRKIVVKCHPDKIDKDIPEKEKLELKQIYETTIEAYDIGEPTPLIISAVKLDIDVKEFEDDIGVIEESCKVIEKGIQEIQATSAWYYEYVLKEEDRPSFLEKFIKLTKGGLNK